MLKFLIDESSGSELASSLREMGYDVLYCGELLYRASDEDILNKAKYDKRIIITNDKDFGEFIFRYKKLSHGVIFLRLKVNKPTNRIKIVLALIKDIGNKLTHNFVIASEDKIRIRKIK